MDRLLHIPTLNLCLATSCFIVSMFLTLLWIYDRKSRALGIWSAGFWLGFVGLVLLSLRDVAPPLLALGVGNAATLSSVGLIWLGCLVFDGRQVSHGLVKALAGGGFWLIAFVALPGFSDNLPLRVIVFSPIMSAYSVLTAVVVWQGYRGEPLPSRWFAIVAFGSHGLVYLVRLPLPLFEPMTIVNGYGPFWFGLMTFEFFVQGLIGALAVFAMVHERTSRQYKIASELDFLTAIPNRRAFLSSVDRLRHGSDGQRADAVLALMDADHFKSINDTHGHGAGDAVLVALAGLFSRHIPPGGVLGRLGGEEFGLYLPARVSGEAEALLDRVRADTSDLRIEYAGAVIQLTISLGAVRLPGGQVELPEALACADRALYASKKAGRNCLSFAEFESVSSSAREMSGATALGLVMDGAEIASRSRSAA